jgi:hypothetical protein
MFGRKRKKEVEGLGLPSADDDSLSAPLGSTSVSVSPSGAAAPSPPDPEVAPNGPDLSELTKLGTTGMSGGAVLAQLLSGHGPVGELVQQIRADPQGFRQRMIVQAQAAGGSAFVLTPQGMTPIGHPAGAPVPTHLDVIDELTKAADLHAKGDLTDEEFEKLKHKLLAQ